MFKNREPGEKALSTLIRSFDQNTTLLKINWRLTSRQSFALTKLLSRNVEILRRKEAGMDYSDIDPNTRRAKEEELVIRFCFLFLLLLLLLILLLLFLFVVIDNVIVLIDSCF